jgi:hypothetical protein
LCSNGQRPGVSEADLLNVYSTLRAKDLTNAWAYHRSHQKETEQQILENEAAQQMARLYANENFPLPAVEGLRRLGHDVLTIQEVGEADRSTPDEEVLAFSSAEKRVLLTLN